MSRHPCPSQSMSASPLEADIDVGLLHISFGPQTDLCIAADRALLDHLICTAEQRQWNRDTKRLGSLQINDHLKLRHLLHRQICRLLSAENETGVAPNHPKSITIARTIARKSAGDCILTKWINSRQLMTTS